MKVWSVTLLIILLLLSLVPAQTRRIVLLEEATNASCGPCAANNPKLQAFISSHFGGVVSIRYHAWWPGNDPMYSLNPSDNQNRIQYYGINGVPTYVMDGEVKGVPGDPQAMFNQMNERLALPAPVKIKVDATINPDTVYAQVTVIGLSTVTQGNLHLRVAIIERMVHYNSPPGSNGERDFGDVMRKMLPDGNGTAIPAVNPGDTLTFPFAYPVNQAWNWQDLAVVAFLQSDATKEVIQAGINLPTYILESTDTLAMVMETNQTYQRHMFLANDNSDTLHVRIKPEVVHLPSSWNFSLIYNNTSMDSLDATIAPGDTLHFQLSVQTGSQADYIKIGIFAQNLDDPHHYGFEKSFFGIIPAGDILFVDDDGGDSWETKYFTAFDSAGVTYTYITEPDLLSIADQLNPSQFSAMFWNVSWGFPAFVPEDIPILENYLDNGGNLYIAGQDIGWDTFDSYGSSNFPAAQNFYHNYLDANYLNDNSGIYQVVGVSGDPITDGMNFPLAYVYSLYPEVIGSYSGNSTLILQYANSTKYAGLRYDNGTYKVVYLGIGLEQIGDPQQGILLIKRVLEWFGVTTGIHANNEPVIREFRLEQNYPNPFNPTTNIRFYVPEKEQITLSIYDMLGRRVKVLVNQELTPGWHQVTWDGRDLAGNPVASGVYVYRLKTPSRQLIRKMMLLK